MKSVDSHKKHNLIDQSDDKAKEIEFEEPQNQSSVESSAMKPMFQSNSHKQQLCAGIVTLVTSPYNKCDENE